MRYFFPISHLLICQNKFRYSNSATIGSTRSCGQFINAKTAVSMQQMLIKLGHRQPRTPMQTDNATALALLTNKILPKALKAMDMRFHWLRCHNAQGQFRYYW
jgi:hypothetical protein